MAREQNLTPWPKGVSGNPKGRAKGRTVRSALKLFLEQADGEKPDEIRRDAAARKLWEAAEKKPEFLLDVLKWLEGSTPKESASDDEDDDMPAIDEHGNRLEP